MADPEEALTASAAEVEAAQKALRPILREHQAVLPDVRPWCMCGHKAETPFDRETHLRDVLAHAVADAVVAAAQPRIAAEERCEVCGGGRVMMHDWVKHESRS